MKKILNMKANCNEKDMCADALTNLIVNATHNPHYM